jgi:hypothetical protein
MLLHILKRKVKKPTIVSKYTMHMTKENGVNSGIFEVVTKARWGSRDRMAVGFTTTCAISAYHH